MALSVAIKLHWRHQSDSYLIMIICKSSVSEQVLPGCYNILGAICYSSSVCSSPVAHRCGALLCDLLASPVYASCRCGRTASLLS
jgi:hypothetical protein